MARHGCPGECGRFLLHLTFVFNPAHPKMTDEPDKSKHWEAIADEIGVEPQAEVPQEPAPPPPLPSERAAAPARPKPAPEPPLDWAALADDLGVSAPAGTPVADRERVGKTRATPDVVKPTQAAPTSQDPTAPEQEEITFRGRDQDLAGEARSEIDFGEMESTVEEPADAESDKRKRRRRRTRRRGTRRQAAEKEGASSDVSETTAETRKETPSKSEGGSRSGGAEKPARPSHKNIPTWDEAVTTIINANLETRSSRSRASRTGSSRGRGRGGKRS